MKCLSIGTLQSYIDGEVLKTQKEEIENHLINCDRCNELYKEILKAENVELYIQEDFNKITDVEHLQINVENAWNKFQNKVLIEESQLVNKQSKNYKREGIIMKKIFGRFTYGVVAATLAVVVFTSYPQITAFANNVISMFFKDNIEKDTTLNSALLDAEGNEWDFTENGQFYPVDYKISDKGLTISISEIFVASSRISLHYTVEDASGKVIELDKNYTEALFIGGGKNQFPMQLYKGDQQFREGVGSIVKTDDKIADGIYSFIYVNGDLPSDLSLDININKIESTEGVWKDRIDLKQWLENVPSSTKERADTINTDESTQLPIAKSNLIFNELSGYTKEDFGSDSFGFTDAKNEIIFMTSKEVLNDNDLKNMKQNFEENNFDKLKKDYAIENDKVTVESVNILGNKGVKITTLKDDSTHIRAMVFVGNELYSFQASHVNGKNNLVETMTKDFNKLISEVKIK